MSAGPKSRPCLGRASGAGLGGQRQRMGEPGGVEARKKVASHLKLSALEGRSCRSGTCGMTTAKQGVDAMKVENPNVKGIWTTIEIDEDGVETVLIVETDLELNGAHAAFDVAKVDALIEAATKSFAASGGTIDRIHLVPIRRGTTEKTARLGKRTAG